MTENFRQIIDKYTSFYDGYDFSDDELLEMFRMCEALWIHDGDLSRPHAELTSGKCSNGFIDCLRVLKYRKLSQLLAGQLARKIRSLHTFNRIDMTIGSPMAGIYFADDLGEALGAPIRMFAEKDLENPGAMLWNRTQIDPDQTVLQVEELTTTSKTLNAVFKAVNEGNATPVDWLPCVAILVHRPPKLPVTHYGDRQVIALIEKEIWAVDPAECPLCAAGSKRLRPKQNWAELTGK